MGKWDLPVSFKIDCASFISPRLSLPGHPEKGPEATACLDSQHWMRPPESPSDSQPHYRDSQRIPPPSWKGLNSLLSSEHHPLIRCAWRPPWWRAGLVNRSVNCWSGAIMALLRVTKCF